MGDESPAVVSTWVHTHTRYERLSCDACVMLVNLAAFASRHDPLLPRPRPPEQDQDGEERCRSAERDPN